jgi:hypothetical protein
VKKFPVVISVGFPSAFTEFNFQMEMVPLSKQGGRNYRIDKDSNELRLFR